MPRAPFDVRKIDLKANPFAFGSVTLTCPCGHRETVTRLVAESVRLQHATTCPACQIPDPDVPAIAALAEALHRTGPKTSLAASYRPRASEMLDALREQGYTLTPTTEGTSWTPSS